MRPSPAALGEVVAEFPVVWIDMIRVNYDEVSQVYD